MANFGVSLLVPILVTRFVGHFMDQFWGAIFGTYMNRPILGAYCGRPIFGASFRDPSCEPIRGTIFGGHFL